MESNSAPAACDVPAQDRCVGWSTALGATQCGVGYLQSSTRCTSCVSGYYAKIGVCTRCPEGGQQYAAVLMFLGIVAGAMAVLLLLIVVLTRRIGGTFKGGVMRCVRLVSRAWEVVPIARSDAVTQRIH